MNDLQVKPLLKVMQFIGAVSGGKTVTQVALNYLMQKGLAFLEARPSTCRTLCETLVQVSDRHSSLVSRLIG